MPREAAVTSTSADSRGGARRPAVILYHHPDLRSTQALRAVSAGLEEEGVLYEIREVADPRALVMRAAELAHLAASESLLGVGVALAADGSVAVQTAKMDPGFPILQTQTRTEDRLSALREMGHDAARIVKGLPLKSAAKTTEPINHRTSKERHVT